MSICSIINLSVGEPTSQPSCIDHFQSVTFHFWINHLSLDPKWVFFKKLILERITFNTWSWRDGLGGGNPTLTFTHPKFSCHLYFNSHHALFWEQVRTSEGRGFQINHFALGQERKSSFWVCGFFSTSVSIQVTHHLYLVNAPRQKPGNEGSEGARRKCAKQDQC